MKNDNSRLHTALVLLVAVALIASAIKPFDRMTWVMEVLPVVLVAPLLWFSRRRFPLTTLLYVLIAVHALVLIGGGTWTYARVPIGNWVQEVFALSRNPYDKLGHLLQGFVPALATRELLIRHRIVVGHPFIVGLLSVCVAMAISANYELIEWAAAVALGQNADDFLGTQGDQWDTQSDMLMALIGSTLAMLLLARWHDRAIRRLSIPR
ncbi:DUF2238 domain-containing protein [Nevskia ramosa]|uniref:DUF2238 domain-containing protein n=1 Tax=Nevskia ramosa TaxID=64002 RepID=UPI003D11E590